MGFVILILLFAALCWLGRMVETKAHEELSLVKSCLKKLELNQSQPKAYEAFFKVLEKCTYLRSKDVFESGSIYDRLLTIFNKNSVNFFIYDIRINLFEKYKPGSGVTVNQRVYASLTSTFENLLPMYAIKKTTIIEKIMTILVRCELPSGKRQILYEKTLEILEKNSDNSDVKKIILSIGRWHFGKSRVGGVPTVYDEQAIQNDILVRSSKT